ncbi:hypothetical protein AB0D33_34090 [Streptomyces sp. NPDC048404]|uniref:hypothetical protein n=1 Tax=unclassified Streptomyces TaxID=2593676 RepID=UPI00343E490E
MLQCGVAGSFGVRAVTAGLFFRAAQFVAFGGEAGDLLVEPGKNGLVVDRVPGEGEPEIFGLSVQGADAGVFGDDDLGEFGDKNLEAVGFVDRLTCFDALTGRAVRCVPGTDWLLQGVEV